LQDQAKLRKISTLNDSLDGSILLHMKGTTMIQRQLGAHLRVSALGLGCMGMSEFYEPSQQNEAESIRVIHRFLDAGGNFLDTADM